jgi:hypothetical protein
MAAEHDGHPAQPDAGGAAEPDCPGAVLAGTVFTAGSGLFDREGRPHVVRIELPLSAGEMEAALYGEYDRLTPADLNTDEEVWGHIAVVIVQDGFHALWQLAESIDAQEPCRALAAPGWLALCRKRVAEVTAGKPGAPLA